MECYEGATMIKTFRGLIADDGIETIPLHTNDGSTGYRIVKLLVMPNNLNQYQESCLKIFKVPQDTATFTFDFSDNTLVAAAYYTAHISADANPEDMNVIFDNEIFNQDLYITQKNNEAGIGINWYLELELIKLDLSENTVATLKDIRNKGVRTLTT